MSSLLKLQTNGETDCQMDTQLDIIMDWQVNKRKNLQTDTLMDGQANKRTNECTRKQGCSFDSYCCLCFTVSFNFFKSISKVREEKQNWSIEELPTLKFQEDLKNAYGRHCFSWRVRIVAPMQNGWNPWKTHETLKNGWKRMKTNEIGWKWFKRTKTVKNGWKWLKTVERVENGWKWLNIVENGQKRSKTFENTWKRSKTFFFKG